MVLTNMEIFALHFGHYLQVYIGLFIYFQKEYIALDNSFVIWKLIFFITSSSSFRDLSFNNLEGSIPDELQNLRLRHM